MCLVQSLKLPKLWLNGASEDHQQQRKQHMPDMIGNKKVVLEAPERYKHV